LGCGKSQRQLICWGGDCGCGVCIRSFCTASFLVLKSIKVKCRLFNIAAACRANRARVFHAHAALLHDTAAPTSVLISSRHIASACSIRALLWTSGSTPIPIPTHVHASLHLQHLRARDGRVESGESEGTLGRGGPETKNSTWSQYVFNGMLHPVRGLEFTVRRKTLKPNIGSMFQKVS
jgi:hypothetical protein